SSITARLAGLVPGLGELRSRASRGLTGGGSGSGSSVCAVVLPAVPEDMRPGFGCSGSSEIVGVESATKFLRSVCATPGPLLMIGLITEVLSLLDLTTLSPKEDGVAGISRFSLSKACWTAERKL